MEIEIHNLTPSVVRQPIEGAETVFSVQVSRAGAPWAGASVQWLVRYPLEYLDEFELRWPIYGEWELLRESVADGEGVASALASALEMADLGHEARSDCPESVFSRLGR